VSSTLSSGTKVPLCVGIVHGVVVVVGTSFATDGATLAMCGSREMWEESGS
jgi:hypothetical protein